MKRLIVLMSFVIVLTSIMPVLSAYSSSTDEANAVRQLEQLAALGVFSKNTAGDLEAQRAVTREEFAKVILYISGQESKAALYKNNSLFKDVKSDRWSNGYIGAVNALGYLKAMPDGLFHPMDAVTHTQAATVFGKLLGYTDNDLSGSWPYSYFTLMENTGIFEGISYKASEPVSRKYLAVMLERLMQTEIKGGSKLFVETTGVFQNIIIFENRIIRKDLDANRVLTDKGVFFLKAGVSVPEAGKKYIAKIEKGSITKLARCEMEYVELSIKNYSMGVVLQNGGSPATLPQDTQYYHNGKAVTFEIVSGSINTNSSIVIGYNKDAAEYAVLFDPVYSEPRVVTSQMLGYNAEKLYGNKPITREGKSITSAMLEVNDVVYEATDIWGRNAYIEVYSNEASGAITAISPNKVAPAAISIADKSYSLSSFFPKAKINLNGTLEVGSRATILLGRDGKAVDILLSGSGLNEDYVLVLDAYKQTSTNIQSFGDVTYFVSLLHSDGSQKSYITLDDKTSFKGTLARYSIANYGTEYDTILLSAVESTSDSSFSYEVKKDMRMLDSSYVSDNVVIFNQINNIYGRKNDASVLKWSDLPSGKLEMGRVRYIHRTGDFADIDVLFVENVLEEQYAYGLVTNIAKTTYSAATGTIQTIDVMINGIKYTYSGPELGVTSGSVLKLRMSDGKILSVEQQLILYASTAIIDAVDSARIRFNGVTYSYHKDLALYKLESGTTWSTIGTSKITKGNGNGTVEIYLDKQIELGGKVVMILVR